jgi:3'-phosphoadenosine 5'-phosphosulfate (PAPS) 3'-phosphatase
MNAYDLESRFLLLKPKIIEAGNKVKLMREKGEITVETKPDGSYVTNADIWANGFLTEAIKRDFPNEEIVGEESENKNYPANAPLVWFIDPIDGTTSFVEGSNDYYVLIGFCYEGIPVLGMHYQPETGNLIYGFTGKAPHLIHAKDPSKAIKFDQFSWGEKPRVFLKTHEKALREQTISFGIKRATYAKGIVDMISPLFGKSEGYVSYRPTHYWDLVAPAAIMRAGGFLTASENANDSTDFRFNDGMIKTNFYYSLPPDTPPDFITLIRSIHEGRLG